MEAFIDDGYTVEVGINEQSGVHPGMEFTYRPMVGNESRLMYAAVAGGDQNKALDSLADHIKQWSLGRPVSRENLERLTAPLFEKLWSIVAGNVAPDYLVESNAEPTTVEEDQKN